MLKRLVFYVLTPAVVPAAFYQVTSMPVDGPGCRVQGWIAFLIALVGMLGGWAVAFYVLKKKRQGEAVTRWWIISALILVVPAVALLAMLGPKM